MNHTSMAGKKSRKRTALISDNGSDAKIRHLRMAFGICSLSLEIKTPRKYRELGGKEGKRYQDHAFEDDFMIRDFACYSTKRNGHRVLELDNRKVTLPIQTLKQASWANTVQRLPIINEDQGFLVYDV